MPVRYQTYTTPISRWQTHSNIAKTAKGGAIVSLDAETILKAFRCTFIRRPKANRLKLFSTGLACCDDRIENPQRKETRDFIFRVRNWSWEIHSEDYDYPAMQSSLQAFCARQFLGRHITLACQLVLEEITSSLLLPLAKKHDITDPHIVYELSVGEGSEQADLLLHSQKLAAAGVTEDEMNAAVDDMSKQILENIVSRQYVDETGASHLVIG